MSTQVSDLVSQEPPLPTPNPTFPFRVKSFQWEDLPAIAEIYNRFYAAVQRDDRMSAEELGQYYRSPEMHPDTDVWTIVNEQNEIVAALEMERSSTGSVRNWGDGAVDPAYWDRGIGTFIVHHLESELRQRTQQRIDADQAVALELHALNTDSRTIKLLLDNGYEKVRSFYRMTIDLTPLGDIEPTQLPPGLELRPFQPEQAQAVYEAHQESFRDHWGFEPFPYNEWEHWVLKHPKADTALWRIVWEGDQIASIALNRPYGSEHPDWGWIGIVGTRRPWRKRGLASLLLRESFRAFKERGYVRAELGVDASSLTNAVAVYQRAGMSVGSQRDAYTKMLHGERKAVYGE
ncbi:MAG: GNAT family N-acetyltransferase [Anaerolineae bacterium]